jgi:hypothetical protein
MARTLRILKNSPTGKLPRSKVRNAIKAIHVFPSVKNRWAVRTIGTSSLKKTFSSKSDAVAFARETAKRKTKSTTTSGQFLKLKTPRKANPTTVVIHDRIGRLTVAPRSSDIVYQVVFDD